MWNSTLSTAGADDRQSWTGETCPDEPFSPLLDHSGHRAVDQIGEQALVTKGSKV